MAGIPMTVGTDRFRRGSASTFVSAQNSPLSPAGATSSWIIARETDTGGVRLRGYSFNESFVRSANLTTAEGWLSE